MVIDLSGDIMYHLNILDVSNVSNNDIHEIDYMCGIDMIIGVIHQCHMQAYIFRWLDAGAQYMYLQSIYNGDAAGLHLGIHMV